MKYRITSCIFLEQLAGRQLHSKQLKDQFQGTQISQPKSCKDNDRNPLRKPLGV